MILFKRKSKEDDFVDDGRVIASMNIDGMRRSIFRRTAFDEFGLKSEKTELRKLSKTERRSLLIGVIVSHIVFAAAVFGSFALFILFCTKIWFKY
ncbi:MAG TPA: hypothetical protein GX505_01020 [Clostridiales bacterium]|nr:hypothetical protein [Clostridiales bacterium]